MDGLLEGIPGIVGFIDDILITGGTEENLKALDEVLRSSESEGENVHS